MIRNQLHIDHQEKRVMDAGCGTAVLSIMASKLSAKEVKAFDIDEWSVLNSKENIEINQCNNIKVFQGKIWELNFTGTFDIILANINKNVLLEELQVYRAYMNKNGILLLSGFYEKDIQDLVNKAASLQLKETHRDVLENWAALTLTAV
jgi:ribosomal protein L11 methyltransferase